MIRRIIVLLALFATACAGSNGAGSDGSAGSAGSAGNDTNTDTRADSSSGGEAAPDPSGGGATQGSPGYVTVGPAILAVPLPGIERGALRPELQQLWIAVEEAAVIAAPAPPTASSDDAIAAWVAGPFTEWIRLRVAATRNAAGIAAALADLSQAERGFAATLIAFAFEDMAASARGAPVPTWIASDPALLGIYAESIDRALLPVAQYAATGYDGCVQLFNAADEPAWNEWAPFCGAHLEDLREVFGRYARRDENPVTQ